MSRPNSIKDFESCFEKTEGCWEWRGTKNSKGYGQFRFNGRVHRAHRLAYEIYVGPLDQLHVCHHCDNPSCVNPEHLFLGTHQDNMDDMSRKFRGRGNSKLSLEQARAIDQSLDSAHYLAQQYGVTKSQIL